MILHYENQSWRDSKETHRKKEKKIVKPLRNEERERESKKEGLIN